MRYYTIWVLPVKRNFRSVLGLRRLIEVLRFREAIGARMMIPFLWKEC